VPTEATTEISNHPLAESPSQITILHSGEVPTLVSIEATIDPPTNTSDEVPTSNWNEKPEKSKLGPATIAGIAVASVLLVLVAVIAIAYFIKRKQNGSQRTPEDEMDDGIDSASL
jgi:hypothetical protein